MCPMVFKGSHEFTCESFEPRAASDCNDVIARSSMLVTYSSIRPIVSENLAQRETQLLSMLRISAQQLQSMRDQIDHGLERFHRARRLSRQIQDDRLPAHAAYRAAQGCEFCLLCAFGAHPLGHAFQQSLTDGPRRFRRDVTRRDASPTGRDNEARLYTEADQGVADRRFLICNHHAGGDAKAFFSERGGHGWAAEVFALSAS